MESMWERTSTVTNESQCLEDLAGRTDADVVSDVFKGTGVSKMIPSSARERIGRQARLIPNNDIHEERKLNDIGFSFPFMDF